MKIIKKTPEYSLVLYIFCFILLKPIELMFPKYSTIILSTALFLVLIRAIVFNHSFNKRRLKKWALFNMLFFGVFVINKICNNNIFLNKYIISFILYATIPSFLLINVNDFSKVNKYYYVFSLIVGAMLLFDPFINYQLTGSYMGYGFNILMFSFVGLILGYYYFKKKWTCLFILIEIVFIAIWGNKGAFITAMALLTCFEYFSSKTLKKVIILVLLGVLAFNIENIVDIVVEFLLKNGYDTYSLRTFRDLFSSKSVNITSARTDIWKEAIVFINESFIGGNGIGNFEMQTGGYVHNVFLDVCVTFGCLIGFLFVILIIYEIYSLIVEKNYDKKIFLLCCLIVSLVPMQISLSFWNVILFWIFEGIEILCIEDDKNQKGVLNSE